MLYIKLFIEREKNIGQSAPECPFKEKHHMSCGLLACVSIVLIAKTLAHFIFWTSLSLRPKTKTKPLNCGLSPEFRLSSHCSAHHCSVHNVIADIITDISVFLCLFINQRKSEVIFAHQNLISNPLTYFVHAKSTGELISFVFSDRSVRSLV